MSLFAFTPIVRWFARTSRLGVLSELQARPSLPKWFPFPHARQPYEYVSQATHGLCISTFKHSSLALTRFTTPSSFTALLPLAHERLATRPTGLYPWSLYPSEGA